ncbi:MAG: S-layer homology domain-containing protein [Firmicutes bacterium]|nr:S-layer homology domain-containing protein [Bacillota bacterium]
MSRAAFTHLLLSCVTMDQTDSGAPGPLSPFRDVSAGHWAAPSIGAAYERGWVKGYGDGRFKPDSIVSRVEATVLLVRVLQPFVPTERTGILPANMDDTPEWARGEVSTALHLGWLVGDPGGDLRLHEPVRFSEACALIWRAMAFRGNRYDLGGVVRSVDAGAGVITIDTTMGGARVNVGPDTALFRNGVRCAPGDIRALDEIYVINDSGSSPAFVEARYIDDVGYVDDIDGVTGTVSYVDRVGVTKRAVVSNDTEVHVLRNKSAFSAVSRGDRAYFVFDSERGVVRLMDVAKMNTGGRVLTVSVPAFSLTARVAGSGVETMRIDRDTIIYRDGSLAALADVRQGDVFQGSVANDGTVLFLQAFSTIVQ